jgi:uncharacterized membrane protein YbhN (UPF0104 family)
MRHLVPLLLIVILAMRVGSEPFLRAGLVLRPGPIAAALLLGLVSTTAQALRWRAVAKAYGGAAGLTRSRAVRECYRSAFLNTALPGGLAGDAVRVWRRRADHERQEDHRTQGRRRVLRSAAVAVVVERAVGTMLLLLAAAAAAFSVDRALAPLFLALALAATAVAVIGLARLPRRARLIVLGWSLLVLTSLTTKFAVAAAALGTVHGIGNVLALAVFLLAGGSVPLGFAGFGPREAAAAYAFTVLGLSAAAGVATSAGFGLLAVVSVLPGAPLILFDPRRLDLRGRLNPGRLNPRRHAHPDPGPPA